jgi:hypothetical protein
MECDYACLNHNSLMSQKKKKVITKGMIIKGVYCSLKDMKVQLWGKHMR